MRKIGNLLIVVLIGLILTGCENVKAKEDFHHVNKGMSSDKIVEILGEPYEKTTDISVIDTELRRVEKILIGYFEIVNEEYLDSLEDTPMNNRERKAYERFKITFQDVVTARDHAKKRENLEMYSYGYKESKDDDQEYIYQILFHNDEVVYLWTD